MLKNYYKLFFTLIPWVSFAQSDLSGVVVGKQNVEGIHVYNKTKLKYTVTNQKGEFTIQAKESDTITFSGMGYKLKTLLVDKTHLAKRVSINLDVEVSELETVYIKPKLSGNLLMDIKSIKTEDVITSSSLGLPNANVERKAKVERSLYAAQSNMLVSLINGITGKTKILKQRVANYKKGLKEDEIFVTFKKDLVEVYKIPEDKIYDFIFYVSNDSSFMNTMKSNDIKKLEFLEAKIESYKALEKDKK